MRSEPVIIIGAGMAGLAASIALAAKGMDVTLLERQPYVGGKMRQHWVAGTPIDAGPTVFTMKWVFDQLFDMAGKTFGSSLGLTKAQTLARHAWDDSGHFDLHADTRRSAKEIEDFFGPANAQGYERFCTDAQAVFTTLKNTFMAASRPSPIELSTRVGLLNTPQLLRLKPFHTLWQNLGHYFPDERLQQLFGRYATYVGSSPFLAPATLMLIAHVEQDGVWLVDGGMHQLAVTMAKAATDIGVTIKHEADVRQIATQRGRVASVDLANGESFNAKAVVYCGDASRLARNFVRGGRPPVASVAPKERSLSAITWSAVAKTSGFALKRHNVFFSSDYRREFHEIFRERKPPHSPTVYVCAQDRETGQEPQDGEAERLLCLMNAPAFGDRRRLDEGEIARCLESTAAQLERSGLHLDMASAAMEATQPADFETLFPASGGALYGRASHGWMASFARPGSKTKLPGLYLAGGSVHPGAGVPMATLSGMLAAEQIIKDRGSI